MNNIFFDHIFFLKSVMNYNIIRLIENKHLRLSKMDDVICEIKYGVMANSVIENNIVIITYSFIHFNDKRNRYKQFTYAEKKTCYGDLLARGIFDDGIIHSYFYNYLSSLKCSIVSI